MPTTVISDEDFRNACAEVADAIASENFSLAAKWYARAEAINAGIQVRTDGTNAAEYRRDSLKGLKEAIMMAKGLMREETDNNRLIRVKTARNGYRRNRRWDIEDQ
jgi:hypothetical protein